MGKIYFFTPEDFMIFQIDEEINRWFLNIVVNYKKDQHMQIVWEHRVTISMNLYTPLGRILAI